MDSMPLDIALTIQLALAPAFLLVGIGQFLILAAGRLARVVDRARDLADIIPAEPGEEFADCIAELRQLDKRMHVVNWAIFLGTAAMVVVCLVVAFLFVVQLAELDFTMVIAAAFVAAMILLVAGLALFLVEVLLAGRSIHVRRDLVGGQKR